MSCVIFARLRVFLAYRHVFKADMRVICAHERVDLAQWREIYAVRRVICAQWREFGRKFARGREARRKGLVGKIEVSTRKSKSPY